MYEQIIGFRSEASSGQIYLQLLQLLSDLDEAQMQFPSKVVSETPIVVMETQVGGANLTDAQLLLLETRCGHGVPVLFLKIKQSKLC